MKRYFNIETRRRGGEYEKWMETLEGEEAVREQVKRMEEFAREGGVPFEGLVRVRELAPDEVKHHLINTMRGWFDSYLMRKSVEELEGIIAAELAAGKVFEVLGEEERR